MKLIDKGLKIKNIPISCYHLEMDGGFRKETIKLMKEDILKQLTKHKITDVQVLEVSLNLGIWAKSENNKREQDGSQ